MNPLVPVGAAIVLSTAVLVGGVAWWKRQAKRVAADRDAHHRGLFVLDPLPPPGETMQILVDDEGGMLAERDARHWPHLGWVDAVTSQAIDDDVLGWRRHPGHGQADPEASPREAPLAEERLVGETTEPQIQPQQEVALSKENSLAAAKCRGCGTELTPANDTAAHVIPNALGGRLKPKGILCDTCNGKLDRLADNALVKAFGDWPTLMDIPRDRGSNPPKIIDTRDGKLVRLEADGTLTRIDVQYDVETFGDSGKLNIGAGDMRTVRQLLQRVRKQYPEFDAGAAEQHARVVGLQDDDELKMGLDYCPRAVFGGVVTALWLFLILKTGRAFMDMTKLEQVIGCVQEHGGMFRYLPDGLPGLKGPDIALSNKVIVRAVPSTGKLIGYVEILGMLQIGGIFAGGGAKGFAVEHIYVHDVLGKKDRSAEYAIDPAIFDRQDWRTVGLGPTVGDGPALEAHFSERLQSVFVHRYHERFAATDPAPET